MAVPTRENKAWARSLNDEALAARLKRMADDLRFFNPRERTALLQEAAIRLTAIGGSSRSGGEAEGEAK